MTIEVLVFGQLKDVVKQERLQYSAVADTQQLRDKLFTAFPGLKDFTFTVAVNKKTAHGALPLQDGDVVALMPAFSGG